MLNDFKSRKWQLTINNPKDLDLEHDKIKFILSSFSNIIYWCMCDEIGENGTYHTHVYFVLKNACCFSTVKNRFEGAHIEKANGTSLQNKEYVTKTGKWIDDAKSETNIKETFEEFGEVTIEQQGKTKLSEEIYEMIVDGYSDCEIMEANPSAMMKLSYINQARQTILANKAFKGYSKRDVTYLWGNTGVGKTRSIMERYGYENVYQITDYKHPFDNYNGEHVIIFEEFRDSIDIADMLKYLDGYPIRLPCRYANKVALYDTVYIISNIPLKEQYSYIQEAQPQTWHAFLRRINHEINM